MEIQNEAKFSYLDEYKILKTLGSGYHAQVKLGIDQNGTKVAIKRYKKETADLKTLQHELNIMKQFDNENLVKLIDARANAIYKSKSEKSYQCFAIIIEYVGGGELFDFVADTGKFSQKVSRAYFLQMMSGLRYMHMKGYAHRDIKPENILLSNQFVIKIADFGFSCLLTGKDGSGVLHTKLGTQGYMAPEIVNKNYDGTKADIFAAGVILFIMYASNPPFQKASANDPYFKLIRDKNFDVFWGAHSRRRPVNYFKDKFKDLFIKMVAAQPSQRITIQEIAKHPWVKQSVSTHQEIKGEFTKRKENLDKIIDKRRQQQEHKKNQRFEGMKNHGAQSRGQDQIDDMFFQLYAQEVNKNRKLQIMETLSTEDLIVNEQLPYVISNLKEFFLREKIPLQDLNGEQIADENDIPFLKVSKLKESSQNKIDLVYQFSYGTEKEEIEQTLQLTIILGKDQKEHIILHFDREAGNYLYYKKIIRQLRNKFAYYTF